MAERRKSRTDAHRLIRVNNIAVDLCNADDTYDHHDQTDDHPCSRCLRYAETAERLMAAARAAERKRCEGAVRDLPGPDNAGLARWPEESREVYLLAVEEACAALAQPADTEGA